MAEDGFDLAFGKEMMCNSFLITFCESERVSLEKLTVAVSEILLRQSNDESAGPGFQYPMDFRYSFPNDVDSPVMQDVGAD